MQVVDLGLALPLRLLPLLKLPHRQAQVLLHVPLFLQVPPLRHAHLLVEGQHVLGQLLFICIFLFLGGLAALFLIEVFLDLVDVLELDGRICSLLGDLVLFLILFGGLELFNHVPEAHLIIRVHLIGALAPILLLGFLARHRQKAAIVGVSAALRSAL